MSFALPASALCIPVAFRLLPVLTALLLALSLAIDPGRAMAPQTSRPPRKRTKPPISPSRPSRKTSL